MADKFIDSSEGTDGEVRISAPAGAGLGVTISGGAVSLSLGVGAAPSNALARLAATKIAEYDATTGAAQMAHLATVDDATKATAFCEALRLYLIDRGIMAAV